MADGYTLQQLLGMYRAECILPATSQLQALTDEYITPHLDEIVRDMFELRAETDGHFLKQLEQPHMVLKPDEGIEPGASKYPISFCLEITRYMLMLMSREPVPAHMTGLQALHAFVRAGGPVKRVWGSLRGEYFQNAVQVGTYYLDVANDTVNPAKPKVEMLQMADANFNNIYSYFEYARVGENYWKSRIIPNTFFPNVAPLLPALVFSKGRGFRLEARNSFLFPMNLDRGRRPARDYVMHEALDAKARAAFAKLFRLYAAFDPRCNDPRHPLWFCDATGDDLSAQFDAVDALAPDALAAKFNRVLGQDTLFMESAMQQAMGAAAGASGTQTPATMAER